MRNPQAQANIHVTNSQTQGSSLSYVSLSKCSKQPIEFVNLTTGEESPFNNGLRRSVCDQRYAVRLGVTDFTDMY